MEKRHIIVMGALAALIVACTGDKKVDPAPAKAKVTEPCEINSDCEANLICLAKECTDTSSRAIYTHPSGSVTPGKVKRHVEDINKKATDRTDKALDVE